MIERSERASQCGHRTDARKTEERVAFRAEFSARRPFRVVNVRKSGHRCRRRKTGGSGPEIPRGVRPDRPRIATVPTVRAQTTGRSATLHDVAPLGNNGQSAVVTARHYYIAVDVLVTSRLGEETERKSRRSSPRPTPSITIVFLETFRRRFSPFPRRTVRPRSKGDERGALFAIASDRPCKWPAVRRSSSRAADPVMIGVVG